MTLRSKHLAGISSVFILILLVLDTKTAYISAKNGMELCLYTVIPSLFPFIFLTSIINHFITGRKIPPFSKLGYHLGLPRGAESIFLLGLLGGYPLGAKAVYDAYAKGKITKVTAQRLLGFCSNPGPAFIFGIIGNLFSSRKIAWLIFSIQILSAIITGLLLPGKSHEVCHMGNEKPLKLTQILENSLKALGTICGWVILFRTITGFLSKWMQDYLPQELAVIICGILELTNGCIGLNALYTEALRFVLACFMLGFGGICVWMQTASVAKELGTQTYLIGKTIQAILNSFFAIVLQRFLFRSSNITFDRIFLLCIASILLVTLGICCLYKKKVVALRKKILYTVENTFDKRRKL